MRRSTANPQVIPLEQFERVRPSASAQIPHASPKEQRERDWFKIENKKGSSEAEVYIYDEIGFWGTSAADFAGQLRDLDVSKITLHLNSPGGEVFDGIAIYNSLVSHKASITVLVDGLAASAASFIAQAGDEVIMGLGATMMIHDASGLCWGNSNDMRQEADVLDKLSNTIAAFYSARAGGSTDMWRGMMLEETWYSAQEAVDAGLADKVSEKSVGEDDQAENRWDLSVFNHKGRSNAPSPEKVRLSVLNRVTKEKAVPTTPQNSEVVEPVEEPVVIDTPETEGVEPAAAPDAESVPPAPLEEKDGGNQAVPTAKASFGVLVNGVMELDPKKVQAHIAALEGFAAENKATARSDYVKALSNDGKIVASLVDSQLALVATLSDEQFGAFKASWDAAPKLPLFGKHGVQTNADSASDARADRISVLQDIVKHHRDSNMSEADIQTKDSWVELQRLLTEGS